MSTIEGLSAQIKSRKQSDLERAAKTCIKSGQHVWERLDASEVSPGTTGYVAYCTRCLKAKIGTSVEWPIHGSK